MRGSVPHITKESKADIDSWGDDMMPKNAACAGHDNLSRSLE